MNYKAPHPEDNASIVFTGFLDGRFAAFDGKSGELFGNTIRERSFGRRRRPLHRMGSATLWSRQVVPAA
jgi:hypothetical protein